MTGRLSAPSERVWLVSGVMDIVAACRAFVSVSDRGSFTIGAAAAGMQQSVASRRIAALEAHLGGELFDRSTRRAQLTPFGRGLLAAARQVTVAAASLESQARRSRAAVVRLAVPLDCSPAALGAVVAACRAAGVAVEPVPAAPDERVEALATGAVTAAVVVAPPEEALWVAPLGVASVERLPSPFLLGTIRPARADAGPPTRLLYEAEDDVPAVRDTLLAHRDAQALAPAQVAPAGAIPTALADVLSGDLLLCPPARAAALGLHWTPFGGIELVRRHALASDDPDLAERLGARAVHALAHALGDPA